MRVIERRVEVHLTSRAALSEFMRYKGMSAQKLAAAVTYAGCPTSKATIGHLMSGHVKRTDPKRARLIAEVLGAPLGMLFVPSVSTVTRDVPPTGRAAS